MKSPEVRVESVGSLVSFFRSMIRVDGHLNTYLNCVISKSTNYFLFIILQAVYPFAILTVAEDAMENMATTTPVCVNCLIYNRGKRTRH